MKSNEKIKGFFEVYEEAKFEIKQLDNLTSSTFPNVKYYNLNFKKLFQEY